MRSLIRTDCLYRAALNGSTARLLLGRRNYSWNPFRRTTITEPQETDELVLEVKQLLRDSNTTKQQMSESLVRLSNNTNENKAPTFQLMNDIIKRLKSSNQIIETLEVNDVFLIYTTVIDNISTGNYQEARFIPRLYLQLTEHAIKAKDQQLLLNTFSSFVKYLAVLGYSDQMSKVIESAVKRNTKLLNPSFDVARKTVLQLNNIAPSVYIRFHQVYDHLGLKEKSSNIFLKKTLDKLNDYYLNRDSIFAVDQNELEITKQFINEVLNKKLTSLNLLKLVQIIDSNDFFIDLKDKSVNTLLSSLKDYSTFDVQQLKSLSQIIITNSSSKAENLLKYVESQKLTPELLDLTLELQSFINSNVNKYLILAHKDMIKESTLNSILFGLSQSKNFNDVYQDLTSFFDEEFPEIFKNIDFFIILFQIHIKNSNYSELKTTFNESISNGIDWRLNHHILFKFLTKLSQDPNSSIPEVFQWYKRIKFFVDYLDSESYNAMMKLFLRNDVEDAIESMKYELPKLENQKKFNKENYPELFNTISNWMFETNEPQDIWDMYKALDQYFNLPYEIYFPLIKKFVSLNRPDLSFNLFQHIKKLHRTTGSIPPPSSEIYIYLFQNFGSTLYGDGVNTLYMILNLDLHINSDINILNSVMGAYCKLQNIQQVLDIYDQISAIPNHKGLNNETVTIMLKTMSLISLDNVYKFWNNLDQLNILPNESNFKQLIIANCYHEQFDTALKLIQNSDDFDIKLTPQLVETLYNWSNDSQRTIVKDWLIKDHKPVYEQIESKLSNIPVLKENDDSLELKLLKS